MKNLKRIIPVSCFLVFTSYVGNAQPLNPMAPAPFGFVELLIGAGALYGSKKVYEAREKKD